MGEMIKLTLKSDDEGKFWLEDQYGRTLSGVRKLDVSSAVDQPVMFNIEVFGHDATGEKYINRRYPKP